MKFNIINISALLAMCLSAYPATGLDYGAWELKKEEEGIRVFTKNTSSTPLKSYRAESIIHANIDSVLNFLTNFDNYKNWMVDCSESKTILRDKNHYIYASVFELPWPLTDRIAVSDVRIKLMPNGVIIANTSPSVIKHETNKNVLALDNFRATYTLSPINNKSIRFEMTGIYDPGGSIPTWVTNFFLMNGPWGTIRVIKEKLE